MKKITIFITQSSGEIDIVLPIISALKIKKNLSFEIFFTSEHIYNYFIKNRFYLYCSHKLKIKIRKFKLLNKFDYKSLNKKTIYYYPLKFISIFKSLTLLPILKKSDIYMHEISNQKDSTNILYYCSLFFKKKIYVYHHGQSFNPTPLSSLKWTTYKNANKKLFLLFHESSSGWAKCSGYNRQHNIGLPASYTEWHKLIRDFNNQLQEKEKYILVFSRGVHKYYMDEDKYVKLITTSYQSIRKIFGNIKIIFKTHPRENLTLLKKLIDSNNMNNIEIVDDYCGILAMNAECVISFWTSAILVSLLLNIPSIEYFIESKKYRTHTEYHNGSNHTDPQYDIKCTDQQNELENFLNKVKKGEEFNFGKFESNFKVKNLNCFN